jgi:hypothetical protein
MIDADHLTKYIFYYINRRDVLPCSSGSCMPKTNIWFWRLWRKFTYMTESLLPDIVPVRLLLLSRSSVRFVNLPSSGGIAPFNRFAWRSLGHKQTDKLWIWKRNIDRDKNLSEVPEHYIVEIFRMLPVSLGMGPTSWFVLRLSTVTFCSLPISFGIEPTSILWSNILQTNLWGLLLSVACRYLYNLGL